MMVGRSRLGIAIVLVGLISFVASSHARDDMAEAEEVARSYMTALFNGDVETAAKLTHTKTLDELRKKYLKDLDKAKADGRERQFLKETGVEADARELQAMSPYELYVAIMKGSRKMGGEQGKAAQGAEVTVERSKQIGKDQISVSLKAVISTGKGPVTKTGGLLLSKDGSAWRVMAGEKKSPPVRQKPANKGTGRVE